MANKLTRILTSFRLAGRIMESWPVQDAKARFSEFLKASRERGPQLVTLRGKKTAVLVGIEEWHRLTARARPGLKALLLAPEARDDLPIPERGHRRRRKPRAGS